MLLAEVLGSYWNAVNLFDKMSITLVHPSRGRAVKAHMTFQINWKGKAVDKNFQHILSIDSDDSQIESYKTFFKESEILINDNRNLIEAVNRAIPYIKGDLVVVVSDDFDCPEKWDEEIIVATYRLKFDNPAYLKESEEGIVFIPENYPHVLTDYAICINDGITFGRKCMTLPILSKSLIDKLGYIYFPGYTGMFADDDLYAVCEKLGVLITKDILFPHNHWVNGKAERDATYNRHNTDESWKHGKKLFEARKAKGFFV